MSTYNRGTGTADVLPSVAGHLAVKPSYVDELESLWAPLPGPLAVRWPSVGKGG